MKKPDHEPIVCGTDFSESAQQAANVAAGLAKQLGRRFILVHGIDEHGDLPREYWPTFLDADRPLLEGEGARVRELGVEVEQQLVNGVSDEGVAKFAEKLQARLVVLGSGGKGRLERWMLGSVAERIAESASLPTLIVRSAAPFEAWMRWERPLKVLVGADFTPVSDAALRWVAELRQIGACEITLCFVDHAPPAGGGMVMFEALGFFPETPEQRAQNEKDLRTKAEHWLGVQPVILRVAPGSGSIHSDLLRLAREIEADLIVVGTHQWQGLSRLRHASVSRRVLRAATMSVACIPSRHPAAGVDGQLPTIRRVLVATDLSEHGGRAILHAYSVLGADGTVCLLHVLKPGHGREPILESLRATIPREAAERGIQTQVQAIESEETAKAICDAGDRFDADLICIGSHGRTGVLAAVMGSVAHAVLASSSRPVLVVRPSSHR